LTARFALTGDQCVEHENQDTQFPSNADRVVTRVSGYGDLEISPAVHFFEPGSQNAAGEVSIEELEPGEGLTLEMAACSGVETTWVGESRALDVSIGQELYVDLFLTPVDAVACLGGPSDDAILPSAHMFGGSAPRDHRSIWLVAGFETYQESPVRELTAGVGVSTYDVPTASLSAIGALQAPRAMAGVVSLQDGRILVAGGTERLALLTAGRPPLWVNDEAAPTPSVEILDTSSSTAAPGPAVTMATLPTCAGSPAGQVVCVGGITPEQEFSSKAWVVDENTAVELDLPTGRYGSTVVTSSDGAGAFVWGGQQDPSIPGQGLWILLGSAPERQPLSLIEDEDPESVSVPLFAAGAQVGSVTPGEYRFVVMGGSDAAVGEQPHSIVAQTARADLYIVNPVSGLVERQPLELGDLSDDVRRFAAGLVSIGDDRVWLYGGVTSFTWDVACDEQNPCFQTDAVALKLVTAPQPALVETSRLEMTAGAFGLSAAPLYDGSWFVTGGMESLTDAPFISRSAALVRHPRDSDDLCSMEAPVAP